MYTVVNPSFTMQEWGVRGSSLHGHVSMMADGNIDKTVNVFHILYI